jgi:hypothetical protein
MRLAFATGELRAVDSAATKSLREAAYEQLLAANGLADFDREDGLGLSEQITEVKLSRAEFQRWVQEQGVLRRDGSATGRLEGREFQILGVSSDQGAMR